MDIEYGTVEGSVDEELRLGTGTINRTRLTQISIAFIIGVTAGMALISSPTVESSIYGNLPSSHLTYQDYNVSGNASAPCNVTTTQLDCLQVHNLGICSKIPDNNELKAKKKKFIHTRILHFLFFNTVLLVIAGFVEPSIKWDFFHALHKAALGCLALLLLYFEITLLFF